MKKRFFKLGKNYIAVDYEQKTVHLVIDRPNELEVKIWTGDKEVQSINKYRGLVEIDQATFATKYSSAVAKLHSQIPYA